MGVSVILVAAGIFWFIGYFIMSLVQDDFGIEHWGKAGLTYTAIAASIAVMSLDGGPSY